MNVPLKHSLNVTLTRVRAGSSNGGFSRSRCHCRSGNFRLRSLSDLLRDRGGGHSCSRSSCFNGSNIYLRSID